MRFAKNLLLFYTILASFAAGSIGGWAPFLVVVPLIVLYTWVEVLIEEGSN